MAKKKVVRIVVEGGVATVMTCPKDVQVIIKDLDSNEISCNTCKKCGENTCGGDTINFTCWAEK